ncbi:hypothetical protein STAQ_39200 [Allostella sp. ATCC 35155]|nr:hypothetical protein STAQ_39200 [Stella sp. ATCC 35155]
MTETAPKRRRLIVSGADAPFFGLLRGLLTSLRRRGVLGGADLGVLDGGLRPEQRDWLESQGVLVRPAEWGFDFPLARHLEREHPSLKVLLSRPRLPAIFPGYDSILWLDADLWVQRADAVALFFQVAERGRLAAVLELDRSYAELWAGRPYWDRVRNANAAVAGREVADALAFRPTINAGALALPASAPHWERWRALTEENFRRLARHEWPVFLVDQLALNRTVHIEGLPFRPLPTWCNWLCHMALPAWDPGTRTLRDPFPPGDPIGLVHVSDRTKHGPVRLPGTDGIWRSMWLTWPPRPHPGQQPPAASGAETLAGPATS